ncbi:MAG: hypothetical protein OEY87_06470, partial [Gammaproteobacteria bacterium]|nr:hypothetical protein [Gammaproteobacteria bacterium]
MLVRNFKCTNSTELVDSGQRLTYSAAMSYNNILLYCRPGFENECAAEITDLTSAAGIYGYVRAKEQSGYVVFCSHTPIEADAFVQQIHFAELVFARQVMLSGEILKDLPIDDRITPLLSQIQQLDNTFCDVWL